MCNHLVELHEHENSKEVHESCVKLEGNICGTDMVGTRHYTLKLKT